MAIYGDGVYGSGSYSGTDHLLDPSVTAVSQVAVALGSDSVPPWVTEPDVWPAMLVEVGLQSGSGSFTLNDTTLGRLNIAGLGDDRGYVWTDVTQWVNNADRLSFSRGGGRNRGPAFVADAGRLSFTLNNLDGRFDPENLGGPYVSAGVSALRPNVPVRVRARLNGVYETLWLGRVTEWSPQYPEAGMVAFVTVGASDGVADLAAADPALASAPAGDTSAERIGRVLDWAEWPTAERAVGGDEDWVTFAAGDIDGQAWGLLEETAAAAVGYLWVDRQGRVNYRSHAGWPRFPQVRFGGDGIPFANPDVVTDLKQVWDTVKADRVDGGTFTIEDLDARAANGGVVRTHSMGGLAFESDTDLAKVATHVLGQFRRIDPQVEQFDVRLTGDSPEWHWWTMLRLEALTHVEVVYGTPDGRTVTRGGLVGGVALRRSEFDWLWTLTLLKAPDPGGDFTLDDAALGVLDVGVLAEF